MALEVILNRKLGNYIMYLEHLQLLSSFDFFSNEISCYKLHRINVQRKKVKTIIANNRTIVQKAIKRQTVHNHT